MTTVVVVARNTLLRAGVIQLLGGLTPDLQVLGFGYTDLERPPDPPVAPDLLMLSVASPERVSALVLASLKAFAPKRIVLMAEGPPVFSNIDTLPRQVVGYIDKSSPTETIVSHVRQVLAGGTCLPWVMPHRTGIVSPIATEPETALNVSRNNVFHAVQQETSPPVAPNPIASIPRQKSLPLGDGISEIDLLGLTHRQYAVLVLLARGLPLKAVARVLNISLGTTKTHTESAYQRLGAHNRQEAINIARARGAQLLWDPGS